MRLLIDVFVVLAWIAFGAAVLGTWFETFGTSNEAVRKERALRKANKE